MSSFFAKETTTFSSQSFLLLLRHVRGSSSGRSAGEGSRWYVGLGGSRRSRGHGAGGRSRARTSFSLTFHTSLTPVQVLEVLV